MDESHGTQNAAAGFLDSPPDLGDWQAEHSAFVESCALVSRADRACVRVTGERRAEMLNGLLTNDVKDLADSARHALLLNAKGRVLTDLRVVPRRDDLLLDVPCGGLGNLLETFKKYLPPLYAGYEDVSGTLRQLGLYGPEAPAAARRALGGDVPDAHLGVREARCGEAAVLVIRSRRLAGDGVEFLVPEAAASELARRLLDAVAECGGRPAGMRALEVARVESGIPRYGVDMNDSNLAQETGLEDEAISYEKGCYLGQEVVSRVHFRGHVNRLLRGFEFADEPPESGTALYDGEKEVGLVTTALLSPRFGSIGLGYVRREIRPSSVLRWSHGERERQATVMELPFRPSSV